MSFIAFSTKILNLHNSKKKETEYLVILNESNILKMVAILTKISFEYNMQSFVMI